MEKDEKKLCMGCMSPLTSGGVCPYCGYDSTVPVNPDYLPPGTSLDKRYLVGVVERHNGESVTYLGYDRQEEKAVWVKEYFPSTLAYREVKTGEIFPKAGSGAQYKALLSDYVELCNEVRRLSVSDPVIPVENMLGENNTIYIIYSHLDVMPLEEYLVALGGTLPAEKASKLLIPLLNAVDNIHLRNLIHRGLSPYTVYVDKVGKIYIGDFALSATRTGGSELDAELFNGYSAPEQYVSTGWQGTWTDVYALATIFYRTISGVVPPKSTRINTKQPLTPLKELVPDTPAKISDAIAKGMRTSASERTQTVASLLSDLISEDGLERTAVFDMSRQPGGFSPEPEKITFKMNQAPPAETINTPIDRVDFRKEMQTHSENSHYQPGRPPVEPSYEEEEYYEEERSSNKGRLILILIIVIVILVGAITAVILSNKLGIPKKKPPKSSKPETSQGIEIEDGDGDENSKEEEEEENTIPSFVDKRISTIENNPDYVGRFRFQIKEENNDDAEEGVIFKQSPIAGKVVDKNSVVVLYVSKGPKGMEMPNLVGMEYEQALQEIARFARENNFIIEELKIERVEQIQVGAKNNNIVTGTSPAAGEKFDPKKDKVEFYVAVPPPVSQSMESSKTQPSSPASSSKPPSSREERPIRSEDGTDVGLTPPPK